MAGSPSTPMPPSPPASMKSLPTDIQLSDMLYAHVHSTEPLPWPFIIHKEDVYKADPAELTKPLQPVVAGDKKAWYFFTELRAKKKYANQKNPPNEKGANRKNRWIRCTDSGAVWHNEGKPKQIVVKSGGRPNEHHYESRRNLFSFKTKKPNGEKVRSGWLMHEYRLQDGSNLVLCKIYPASKAGNEVEAVPPEVPPVVLHEALILPKDDLEFLYMALGPVFPGQHLY